MHTYIRTYIDESASILIKKVYSGIHLSRYTYIHRYTYSRTYTRSRDMYTYTLTWLQKRTQEWTQRETQKYTHLHTYLSIYSYTLIGKRTHFYPQPYKYAFTKMHTYAHLNKQINLKAANIKEIFRMFDRWRVLLHPISTFALKNSEFSDNFQFVLGNNNNNNNNKKKKKMK